MLGRGESLYRDSGQDDFVTSPSGLIINGTSFTFQTGSAFDLGGSFGPGGHTGTVSATWNALGLDDHLQCSPIESNCLANDTSGKAALIHLDNAQLAAIGIGIGTFSVDFEAFGSTDSWDNNGFAENGTVSHQISQQVPGPASLALLGLGLLGLAWRRKTP